MMEVCFSVTGEFVTKTARSWYWYEERGLEKTVAFLMSCLMCDTLTEEQRRQLSIDILFYKGKMVGNTRDDSYSYEEGDNTPSELAMFVDRFYHNPPENMSYSIRKKILDRIKEFQWHRKYGEDGYGWLTPTGKFIPSPWGTHSASALDIIEEHKWTEEGKAQGYNLSWNIERCRDFLIDVKGYVLLHNVYHGIADAEHRGHHLTKKQADFLFSYYTDLGQHDKAEFYLLCMED